MTTRKSHHTSPKPDNLILKTFYYICSNGLINSPMKDSIDVNFLFTEYRDKCYGFFIKLLGNQELAKDLTQDVFLLLLRKKTELDDVRDWDNYIYVMCRNRAYDHLKKAAHDQKYRDYLFRYWNQSANLLRPSRVEKEIEASHYQELLEESLKNLPDQQRLIFNMSKKEGLSHQVIAEKLDISPITVRNHLHRALKNIRAATHPDVELVILALGFWLLALGG